MLWTTSLERGVTGVQDRFVGDVGDFGKYGLLKALCEEDLSLGVVWYLIPDEDRPGDGGHVGFLGPTPRHIRRFRDCDPPLYDILREIVRSGRRRVASVGEHEVLPEDTTFYDKVLSFEGIGSKVERLDHRSGWVWEALEVMTGRNVVYVDPDNGLESGEPRTSAKGTKYAYFDELGPYVDRDQSLVVFQSRNRATLGNQMKERLSQVNDRLGESFALFHRPYAGRTFFVIPSESHMEMLHERAERFALDPCWSQHFTLIEPEEFD